MKQFAQIKNNIHFSEKLPADKIKINNSRQVHNACFSYIETKNHTAPEMIHFSSTFIAELGIKINTGKE